MLFWKGAMLFWKGAMLSWKGALLFWKGALLFWKGAGLLFWRGRRIHCIRACRTFHFGKVGSAFLERRGLSVLERRHAVLERRGLCLLKKLYALFFETAPHCSLVMRPCALGKAALHF
jgi:hypothetical protein